MSSTTVRKSKYKKHKDFVSIILMHDQNMQKMRCYGPICFLAFGKKTLLDKQIEAINKRFENYEIIIAVTEHSEKLYSYVQNHYHKDKIRIVENPNSEHTSSCETARLCIHNINNDKILFIEGSLFFEYKIFDNLKFDSSFAMVNSKKEESLEIGANTNKKEGIEYFCYGANSTWSEILFLHETKTLSDLDKVLNNKIFKRKFFFEAINEILSEHNITKKRHSTRVVKIKNNKTYKRAKE